MGHYLVLATTEIQEGTSLEARQRVYDFLAGLSTLADRFWKPIVPNYEPMWDYFTVGGAWSGFLLGEEAPSDHDLGEDYDAQVVSQDLFLRFLNKYRGKSIDWDENSTLEFVDLEGESCFSLYIGRKWLVVVDIHV